MSTPTAEEVINAAEQMMANSPSEAEPVPELISLAPVPDPLPPRPWHIEGLLMDRNVTMLTGKGGGGKSLLALQLAIATSLGTPFAWWKPWQKRKVLLLNAEDDIDELQRRILSICAIMGVEANTLSGHLFALNTQNIVLLTRNPETEKIERTPLYDQLTNLIQESQIGLLVIDPLIETHAYLDENSNTDMKGIIVALRSLAHRCNIPVLVVHHSRKGAAGGDQDGARGGSALVNACRVVLTLDRMDAETHERLMPPLPKEHYVRVAGAKANYAACISDRWLEIESVHLKNGDYSPGLKRVDLGELEEGFDPYNWGRLDEFLNLVREGRGGGMLWSAAKTGRRDARLDAAVADRLEMDMGKAKATIKCCEETGLIRIEERKGADRKLLNVWVVDEQKARPPEEAFK